MEKISRIIEKAGASPGTGGDPGASAGAGTGAQLGAGAGPCHTVSAAAAADTSRPPRADDPDGDGMGVVHSNIKTHLDAEFGRLTGLSVWPPPCALDRTAAALAVSSA